MGSRTITVATSSLTPELVAGLHPGDEVVLHDPHGVKAVGPLREIEGHLCLGSFACLRAADGSIPLAEVIDATITLPIKTKKPGRKAKQAARQERS